MDIKIDCVYCKEQMETVIDDQIQLSGMTGGGDGYFRRVTLYFCSTCQKYFYRTSEPIRAERLR